MLASLVLNMTQRLKTQSGEVESGGRLLMLLRKPGQISKSRLYFSVKRPRLVKTIPRLLHRTLTLRRIWEEHLLLLQKLLLLQLLSSHCLIDHLLDPLHVESISYLHRFPQRHLPSDRSWRRWGFLKLALRGLFLKRGVEVDIRFLVSGPGDSVSLGRLKMNGI